VSFRLGAIGIRKKPVSQPSGAILASVIEGKFA